MITKTLSAQKNNERMSKLEEFVSKHGIPIARGIEKEGLRATENYDISQLDHPKTLGHPLTHSSITTDYSEALLELITPVETTRDDLLATLKKTHQQVAQNIGDEVFWAGSMPCRIKGEESIRIAEYGDSNLGQLKHVYRQGLGVRYGRIMQSIAGLHFNFSLSDSFWTDYQQQCRQSDALSAPDKPQSLQDFKSEQYFALTRNFRRHSWLLMYLFGASPALDHSFLNGHDSNLEAFDDQGTYFKPYATSLRMGDLGYHNNAQSSLTICFNNLNNFTQTLGNAIHTPYPEYEKIGLKKGDNFIQLNTNILQIENEYYSSIRPKRSTYPNEKPRHALTERGVEYIEVRCLDLNPFLALGISSSQIDFLDLFLMNCLLTDSPYIDDDECLMLDHNFDLVVNEGRKPDLKIKCRNNDVLLQNCGEQLLSSMLPLAKVLDKAAGDQRYQTTLKEQIEKILNPELTPSAQVLSAMRQDKLSWLSFAGELSKKHKAALVTDPEEDSTAFKQTVRQSFLAADKIKSDDIVPFSQFMQDYQAE